MAAVLACGDGAVLSGRSAAALHGLRPDNRATVDVSSPRRSGRERKGIDAHSGHGLLARDITAVDGIPCTSIARTILDLAEVLARRELERVLDRAEVLRTLDMNAITDVLDRSNGRRGAPILRAVLVEHRVGSTLTVSELEERFLLICRQTCVRAPEVNAWVALADNTGYRADFLWRGHRLIVETDGHAAHGTRRAFERDRERDQRLMRAGWRVVRFSYRQITREPERVAETLRALLVRPRSVVQ